jgi:DUF4097 and DUF4098 domain-containing protein YvlB
MRKRVFFTGAIIWTLIFIALISIIIITVTGSASIFNLGEFFNVRSFSAAFDANTPLVKEETFTMAGVTELGVNALYQDIIIKLTDGVDMTVRHYDIDASPFTSQTAAGGSIINISVPTRVNVSINMANPRLEIDLPRSYAGAVKLDSSSGEINMNEYAEWSAATLISASGDVRFQAGIKCENLKIETSSGTVRLGDADANSINIKSASGDMRMNELRANGDIVLKSSSGTMRSSNITAVNLKIESLSGDINIGDVTVVGNADISSSSGSQYAGLVKTNTYKISGLSGTLRYSGLSGAGSVSSSSGTITCNALDVKGDVSFIAASGNQRISLAPDQNIEVKISVTSGDIRAPDLALYYTDRLGRNATGKVGDGSAGTLDVRSSSGNITISV